MLENYTEAARIRDNLRILHEDRKASVLAANSRFYDAFSKGNLASMQALWAKGEHIQNFVKEQMHLTTSIRKLSNFARHAMS
ncbi:hypothetical protein AKJ16_DCAP02771 [Drosera capensis]